MAERHFSVVVDEETREVPAGMTYQELAKSAQQRYPHDIVLARVNGRIRELHHKVTGPEEITFITTGDSEGNLAYERSLLMLLNCVLHEAWPKIGPDGVTVRFSVTHGLYLELPPEVNIDEAFLSRIKDGMIRKVSEDIPFVKENVPIDEIRKYFRNNGSADRAQLLRFRRNSRVNIYQLGGYHDYYYGHMVPSTGYLRSFDLAAFEDGFILLYPQAGDPGKIAPFVPQPMLFSTLQRAEHWAERLKINTASQINTRISEGKAGQLILVSEALHEAGIASIAQKIAQQPGKKIILIAGPSSSGKTSFSHRLSIQLTAQGLSPYPIGVDDYFKNREDTPKDEKGNYDFESIGAVDTDLFNRDLATLLEGGEIELPTFNFVQGRREYRGKKLRLEEQDILVIEGIHCLNPALTAQLPDKSKFRIYISALNQMNIDNHNRVRTTDGRLLRRIVRDARTRGTGAEETLARWQSVRRGEDRNIFPFQESADVMFNSSLAYELCALKPQAEQLLFGIPEDSPQAPEARRLLKLLDYFLAIDITSIPINSLVREFVGGSCFNV